MPSSEEYNRTLGLVADYVRDIGDEVTEENVEELFEIEVRGTDYEFSGHRCKSGDGSRYLVAGHPELRGMMALYFFSVRSNTGGRIDEDIIEAIDHPAETEEEEDPEEAAAEVLLDRVSREEMDALKNYLYMFVSGASHETSLYTNDQGSLIGFHVSHMFFPYERTFGLSEFYDAVQSSLSAGNRGNHVLARTIFVNKNEENPEESEIALNFSW